MAVGSSPTAICAQNPYGYSTFIQADRIRTPHIPGTAKQSDWQAAFGCKPKQSAGSNAHSFNSNLYGLPDYIRHSSFRQVFAGKFFPPAVLFRKICQTSLPTKPHLRYIPSGFAGFSH